MHDLEKPQIEHGQVAFSVSNQPTQTSKNLWLPLLLLVGWAVAGLVLVQLFLNPPRLQFQYDPAQLRTTRLDNGTATGFYGVQRDDYGNEYSWTQPEASLLLNLQSYQPIYITFEVRGAAVAGGPVAPVEFRANNIEIAKFNATSQNPQFQPLTLRFIPSTPLTNTHQLKLNLKTEAFNPGSSDPRILGTMIKSIKLDTRQAWSGVEKRYWLYWALPGLALIAAGLYFCFRRYHYQLAGYGSLTALAAGAELMAAAVFLISRVGIIDPQTYLLWLLGTIYLGLVFALTALKVGADSLLQPQNHLKSLYSSSLLTFAREARPLARIGLITLLWLVGLAFGSLLLYGRYNWNEADGQYAPKSYFSALYFFWLVVPVSYYLTLAIWRRRGLALGVGLITFVVTCLPYQWLGLGPYRLALEVTRRITPGFRKPDEIIWFPGAFTDESFPGEKLFFLALLVSFGAIVLLFATPAKLKPAFLSWAQLKAGWNRSWPFLLVFLAIVLQTWLHTSLRSPYTYTPHYEQEPAANYWYLVYMVEGNKAGVNSDAPAFVSLDDYFNGRPKTLNTLLLRRSFVAYLTSSFTYFFNYYYVYLIFNCLVWFSAVVATYYYIKRVTGKQAVALYSAGLVCCGPGFIYFVAQPMSYVAAYAVIILCLYFYEVIMVRQPLKTGPILLFGAVLGLCACVYDLFPLYPMFLLYSLWRKVSFWKTAASLAISLVLYLGFLALQFQILGQVARQGNSDLGTQAVGNIFNLLTDFQPGRLYNMSAEFLSVYARNLGFAFLIISLLLGLAGLVVANRHEKGLLLLLFLPSLALNLLLFFGGTKWFSGLLIELPRLSYIAYPALYLGGGLALAQARLKLERTTLARFAPALPWLIIALLFAWHNLDSFGYPSLYYHFYWPKHQPWLDRL